MQFAWWALATIVFTLVVAIRIRLLGIPLERDEGEYAYAGQLILQGIPPYKLAYNTKFPGTYAAYAVIMSIFGQTAHAIPSAFDDGIHLYLWVNGAAKIRAADATGDDRELEAARPKYLISVAMVYSWLRRPDSDEAIFN